MLFHSWRRYSPLFALTALSACQHAAVAPAAASAPVVKAPASAVLPVAAAATTPEQKAPEVIETSPFIEGVRLGYPARLAVAGKNAFLSTEKLLLGIHEDRVTIDPALLVGLHTESSAFPRVFGSMPEAGWAVEVSYAERTSRSTLSRWTGTEWLNADALLPRKNVISVSPWSAGRTLALVADPYSNQLAFVQLGGARGVPVPEFKTTKLNDFGCSRGIQPTAMSATSSGEVFLAGTLCSVSEGEGLTLHGTAVERWGAGQARGTLTTLPQLAEQEAAAANLTSIIAVAGNDVFVAGARTLLAPEGKEAKDEAYVAHFDGKTWHTLSAPPTEDIEELQRSPDGKLSALAKGDLWATTGAASETTGWVRVALPRFASEAGEHAMSTFWVRGNGDVWATLGSEAFSYVVRTQRGAEPLTVPSDTEFAQLSQAFDPMASEQCENPTLVLLTLSRQAPQNADIPSIRAALRGHSELAGKAQFIELSFLTQRYVGVRGDRETLQQASDALLQSNIPGVNPQLRCLNAPATRTLAMDFSGKAPALHATESAARGKFNRRRAQLVDFD